MKWSDLTIDCRPAMSRHNALTAEAIAADVRTQRELLRKAIERIRNTERRRAWAERWRAHFGAYPSSHIRTDSMAGPKVEAGRGGAPVTAKLLIHPTFFRQARRYRRA